MTTMNHQKRQHEEHILNFWEQNNIFEKTLTEREKGNIFSFFDGPPFATGLPHYGHILASTIKDVVGRYWTMRGFFVPRRWGWDCHGLPIENIIEDRLNISGKKDIEKIGIEKFNATCKDAVLRYADEWKNMIQRIGRWVEFQGSYKTMDSKYMESVWWAIKQIWDKGLIYEGRKVLLYCPRCETPISNFEVAMDNSYEDVTEESVFVRFHLKDNKKFPKDTSLLVWTTTPWTLPSNWAVAAHPDMTYVLVQIDNERLIMAKDAVSSLSFAIPPKKQRTFSGRELQSVAYEPLYPIKKYTIDSRYYRIYLADFVTKEEGTGLVHMAPYGEEDFALSKKHHLEMMLNLNERGHFTEEAPKFLRGVYFKKADNLIKNDLETRKLLYKRQLSTHSYPFCWRCATPLFYNPLPAWFINIQKIKLQLIENNEVMHWYPSHLKYGRFKKGLENAPDWNISRNRYWATPLPFWRCDNATCKETVCIGSYRELQEKSVIFLKIYRSREPESMDVHRPTIDRVKLRCGACGDTMTRVTEVVDCWVESASMPFAEIHYPFENKQLFEKRFPAHFVAEYIAQTRAWFYVTHVLSTILFEEAPFKNVVTTGTILNEKGEKLSKSKKNFPDPEKIIEKYGADTLRFYLMSSVVMNADNLFFSEKGVDEMYKKVILLLKNATTFYSLYPNTSPENFTGKKKNLHLLDRWILSVLQHFIQKLNKNIGISPDNFGKDFNIPEACRNIRDFIDLLSTWYIRRSRERIKAGSKETIQVFQCVLEQVSRAIAPIVPFIAEQVYKHVGAKEESVHLASWPKVEPTFIDKELEDTMQRVRTLAADALKIRAETGMKVRQKLAELYITEKIPEEYHEILREEVNVQKIVMKKGKGKWHDGTLTSLNIELSQELKEEGMVRELIRLINQQRKTHGFTIHDRALLLYSTESSLLQKILKKYRSDILSSTLSNDIKIATEASGEEKQVNGEKLFLSVVKK